MIKLYFIIFTLLVSSCTKQYPSVITLTNECPPRTHINLPSDLTDVPTSSEKAFIAFDQDNWKKIVDIVDAIVIDKQLQNKWAQENKKND